MRNLRPLPVLKAFWDEVINVESDAMWLEPVYVVGSCVVSHND